MLDIHDELLVRAKGHARKTGRPLRTLVEDGLLWVLQSSAPRPRYALPDLRADDFGEIRRFSCSELRDNTASEASAEDRPRPTQGVQFGRRGLAPR